MKNPFFVLVALTGIATACGFYVNARVFVLAALLLVVTILGVVTPWVAVRGIRCRLKFDVPRSRVGQPVIVRLQIQNRWPIPVFGLSLIRGFAQSGNASGSEGVSLARVPALSRVEYAWPFRPTRRGCYPNGQPEVETGFPFGLYRARRPAEVDGSRVVVWPKTVELDGMPDAVEAQSSEEQLSDRRVGQFGDMMGTRLFRDGDSLRRVHWAQTARQQTLIVTERQAPAMTAVTVVVDLSEDAHRESDRNQSCECVISVAASVCESLYRQHARVECLIGDECLVAGDGAMGFRQIMDALAVADVTSDPGPPRSAGDEFRIVVTTGSGTQSWQSADHVIVIGDQAAGHKHNWISLSDYPEALEQLTQLWGRACHGS